MNSDRLSLNKIIDRLLGIIYGELITIFALTEKVKLLNS